MSQTIASAILHRFSLNLAQTTRTGMGRTSSLGVKIGNQLPVLFACAVKSHVDLTRALNTLPSFSDRREQLTKQFFKNLLKPSNCLHNLISNTRYNEQTSKLRSAAHYPVPTARTERFRQSTNALTNYYQ